MLKALTFAVLAGCAATALQAEAWLCEMKAVDRTGWISHRLEIHLDRQGQARVLDSAIQEIHGAPITVTPKENAGVRLQVDWIARNLPVNAGLTVARPHYSAFLNRNTGRVTVTVNLAVGDMFPSGAGRCVPTSGKTFQPTSPPRKRFIIEVPFD